MIEQNGVQQEMGRFLHLLACPSCKSSLQSVGDTLQCSACNGSYPVIHGIPILVMARDESKAQLDAQREIFNPQFASFAGYKLDNWRVSYLSRIFRALHVARTEASDPPRYLDIGVGGSGYTVIEAARLGYLGVGCDLSIAGIRKAIEFARDQGVQDRTFFVVCSAEMLPFQPSVFDAVSCIAVLEHLVRDDLAAQDIARVTKPRGRFFVTVPHTLWRTNPLFWYTAIKEDRAHGHLRRYTARSLSQRFGRYFENLVPVFSVRFWKGFQYVFEMAGRSNDHLWWLFEKLDLRNENSPWGAMIHLHGSRSDPPVT